MKISKIVLFMALFFVLGYTHLFGGPYGFFKFLFVLSLIGVIITFLILRKIFLLFKTTTKKSEDETIKVDSKVIE